MLEVKLAVKLVVQAPFSTQSSSLGPIGVDSPLARRNGIPYIPGTLLKGRLRQSWRELHSAAGAEFAPDENRLLGEPTGDVNTEFAVSVEPRRSLLQFSDFLISSPQASASSNHITRIQMHPELGSVRKGSYQVIESPSLSRSRLTFAGLIHYFVPDTQSAQDICGYVEKGLRWITSLGAERTVGFGRLLEVTIDQSTRTIDAPAAIEAGTEAGFDLLLTFSQPFCIAKRRISDNLFQSDQVIPGAVLKGAIASTWAVLCGRPGEIVTEKLDSSRPELCRNFEKIRFTHAFPSNTESFHRPVVPPLSLVRAGSATYDVLLDQGPRIINHHAPRFMEDWKAADHDSVRAQFGWSHPRTQLRVRTQISASSRRAEESMLFAYELIEPSGFVWQSRVDFSRLPQRDRAAAKAQLRSLLNIGIYGLGKTKASASVQTKLGVSSACNSKELSDGLVAITLQSATLLCDPKRLTKASGSDELHAAYGDVWHDLSLGSLELQRYFAKLSLAGGFYLHRRFRKGEPYAPWLLTEPGSVFLFRKLTPQAEQLISNWQNEGLPLPSWAISRYTRASLPGNHWSNCPYIPENGYGEIMVNLDAHQERRIP